MTGPQQPATPRGQAVLDAANLVQNIRLRMKGGDSSRGGEVPSPAAMNLSRQAPPVKSLNFAVQRVNAGDCDSALHVNASCPVLNKCGGYDDNRQGAIRYVDRQQPRSGARMTREHMSKGEEGAGRTQEPGGTAEGIAAQTNPVRSDLDLLQQNGQQTSAGQGVLAGGQDGTVFILKRDGQNWLRDAGLKNKVASDNSRAGTPALPCVGCAYPLALMMSKTCIIGARTSCTNNLPRS